MAQTTKALTKRLLRQLRNDLDERLLRIDNYVRGYQDDPYMPETADQEYRQLADRAKTNVLNFVVVSSTQAMYVDQFRRGDESLSEDATRPLSRQDEATRQRNSPEWDHWQHSRLDARQQAVYRSALIYGHSFVVTEKRKGKIISKGLSPLNTTALFEDPANDETPYIVATVTRWPQHDPDDKDHVKGKARVWDGAYEYEAAFSRLGDDDGVEVGPGKRHGANECPVTRFAAAVDLEGRTTGVVEPLIPLQDRLNQTVFDLLVVQSFASFKVRTVSGMAPPVKRHGIDAEGNKTDDPEKIVEYEITLDGQGNPIPENINLNAKRFFWAEDAETKFNTLDETPLDGFLEAIKLGFQHIAALSQTPPHHLLGQIANLSAEALTAAETALMRKVEELQNVFGESWERVFRLAAEMGGTEGAENYHGEVIWRDMDAVGISQTADALGKLHDQLGVPRRGLWRRIPGVTGNELAEWEELDKQETPERELAQAVRTGSSNRPTYRATRREREAEVA